jgi:hypothetical protein
MKIGEALALLKSKKSRISKLLDQRKESFYVDKGDKPSFNFEEITKEIDRESDNLLNIKLGIIKANNETLIDDTPLSASLQETILEIGELRSYLANLDELMKKPEERWSAHEIKPKTPQISLQELDKLIQSTAQKKSVLDAKLQAANWKNSITIELK